MEIDKKKDYIICKNINKSYTVGGEIFKVLDDLTISVNFNEFLAIMGSSGSGKSTLLNIIGLLEKQDSGDIYINNHLFNNFSEDKKSRIRLKKMGFVFQDFYLISEMNLFENVAVSGIANGMEKDEAFFRAKNLLTQVGLKEHIEKKPSQLSGGQKQRVAIARALINSPLILFADEPTANLDHKTSIEIIELFKKLQKENFLTIIMVTHEEEFKNLVDRTIYLKEGKIVETSN